MLTLFSASARNLQRKLPSVAEYKPTCLCHGDFYQHILSHLLASCGPGKTGAFGIRWLADIFRRLLSCAALGAACKAETMLEHRENTHIVDEAYLALSSDLTHFAR
jgi:hypothetical protein